MTDIDMEVDAARPLGLDNRVDDDFIDFDTDMAEVPQGKDPNHEKHTDEEDMHAEGDMDEQELLEPLKDETDEIDVSAVKETHVSVLEAHESDQQNETELGESGVQVMNDSELEASHEGHSSAHIDDDFDSTHEIDYENDDAIEQVEAQGKVEADLANEALSEESSGDVVDHLDDHHKEEKNVQGDVSGSQEAGETDITHVENQEISHEEYQEITWDEEKLTEELEENEQANARMDVRIVEEHAGTEFVPSTAQFDQNPNEQARQSLADSTVEESKHTGDNAVSGELEVFAEEDLQDNKGGDVYSNVSVSEHNQMHPLRTTFLQSRYSIRETNSLSFPLLQMDSLLSYLFSTIRWRRY